MLTLQPDFNIKTFKSRQEKDSLLLKKVQQKSMPVLKTASKVPPRSVEREPAKMSPSSEHFSLHI